MNPSRVRVRRANLDDLEPLRQLWQREPLAADSLEKRLTEFQVVEGDADRLLGAIGLHIEGRHGKLHSEVVADPEHGEAVRRLLWERLQVVAKNHGLARLWTQETGAFWQHSAFQEASMELRQQLPAGFGDRDGSWRTLQLREEVASEISVEREFELFRQQQAESTARLMRQGRALKWLATLLALALLGLVVTGVIHVFRHVSPPRLR